MFRNDLFIHSEFERIEDGFRTTVFFNWEHPVFNGHFPEKPVVPGVLLMQMGMAVIMLNRRMLVAMRLAFA